jgi:ribosomal protein S6--L-glutamate ligase
MKLVSFDALRTLKLPDVTYIKPELFSQQLPLIKSADWVLFPQHWQVNALVYGLQRRIFPSQASYLLGHDKIEMTRAFSAVAPEHVPETLIEANDQIGAERVWDHLPRPFVAKIPRSSMGEGVFLIHNRSDWQRYLAQTPVIYAQEHLPIDRDLRIVYVGNRIVGSFWRLQSAQGFHNNVARGGVIDRSPIPKAARDLVLRLARTLGIDHAGFDIAMVGRHPYVLEFNRLFGNRGLQGAVDPLPGAIMDYLVRTSGHNGPSDPSRPRPRLRLAV